MNQRTLCADVPWVNESGTTRTLALLLQAVVANGVGGVQGFFDVARFQPVQALLGIMGPDPGQAIGLKFLAHQQATVAFHLPTLLASGLNFRRYAEQGLHVVSDFVSDHVGLREIPRRGKALQTSPERNSMSRYTF